MRTDIPLEILDEYNGEISKAGEHLILTNQPGKTSPRWFASLRNLNTANEMAANNGIDTRPIAEKAIDAMQYLWRNIVG